MAATEGNVVLSRFEAVRLIGLRSLHLSQGARPLVEVRDDAERENTLYVAAREISERKLDAIIQRGDVRIDVRRARLPPCVGTFLANR
jgi:DNA-directed RNA polymerase subunit K/omega